MKKGRTRAADETIFPASGHASATNTSGNPPGILILAEYPLQWTVPLYRHLARTSALQIEVAFEEIDTPIDNELGQVPQWHRDLTAGYRSSRVPTSIPQLLSWLAYTRPHRRYALIIVPGWAHRWSRALIFAAFLSRSLRRRLVIFTDSTDLSTRSRQRDRLRSSLLRTVSRLGVRFAVPGTLARDHLHTRGVPLDQIYRLPYAVDNDWFASEVSRWRESPDAARAQLGLEPTSFIILSVTKFTIRELPTELMRSFIAIQDEFPNAHLLIVGDGPQAREVIDLAQTSRKITLVGYLPYARLPLAFAAADIFVHVPRHEPWGLSVNEAAASSLPILASTTVGSSHDLVVSGRNGYVVPLLRVEIENALRTLLSLDRHCLHRMGAASATLSHYTHYDHWAAELRRLMGHD